MDHLLLLALLAPFALAVFMPALSSRLGPRTGLIALLAPLASAAAIGAMLQQPAAARLPVSWDWVPSLGVALTFNPDGLALFYGLVVSGIGVLVVAYASAYLDSHYRDHGKFYCYLLLFMGAMLATVFSSNLLVLFVAWELTGLTSFLLIGFLHDKAESRRGARMALLTTGLTGLALLAGVVLLRLAYGTFELTEILAQAAPLPGREHLLTPAFLCCFLGIAGKSAQFPFHYWLPNAMAAPTPVSAYLHSARL
jgi:NADH:ubiquinone oxidoreductase subunit 5 (subunit L)/multisubunit Na+/H+ antiporter MnhA subunit